MLNIAKSTARMLENLPKSSLCNRFFEIFVPIDTRRLIASSIPRTSVAISSGTVIPEVVIPKLALFNVET